MLKRSPVCRALASIAATAITVTYVVPVAFGHDTKGTKVCAPTDPVQQETALLTAAASQGWKLTASGRALLNGVEPTATVDPDGTIQGGATLAIAPTGGLPDLAALKAAIGTSMSQPVQRSLLGHAATRTPKGARRMTGSTVILMNCGLGQQANVNYYVVGGDNVTWTHWELHNWVAGQYATTNSATNICPGNGGCIEYFYVKPASPWYVWSATERATIGLPEPLSSYCGG